MKFNNLFTAALIVSASAAAFAQQDTTRAAPQAQSQSQQPQSPNQQPSEQFNVKEYSEVQSSGVPASLRTTLQGDQDMVPFFFRRGRYQCPRIWLLTNVSLARAGEEAFILRF
ncbi:MAG TPA: hypothetical protein VK658_01360 [Chryseolinea sp.]|nr:hypothetical protein [Chryseolinea sp.]